MELLVQIDSFIAPISTNHKPLNVLLIQNKEVDNYHQVKGF